MLNQSMPAILHNVAVKVGELIVEIKSDIKEKLKQNRGGVAYIELPRTLRLRRTAQEARRQEGATFAGELSTIGVFISARLY